MQTQPSIKSKIARGATWMLLFRLTDRGLAFVSTIILARVLVPADFGLVAMAMSVIALIELTGAFSLEVGLIQRPHPTRAQYDTTWTLRLLFGVFGAVATAAAALPAAKFYNDDRLSLVLFALAGNWLVSSVDNIGVVDFRRELNFRREYFYLVSKRLIGLPVTLVLAITYRTYWALIAGTVAGTAGMVLCSYAMHPYRPRLSLAAWRELLSFSIWLFLNNLLSFLYWRLSHFIIGRSQGANALGIYTVATDFAALASTEITAPVNRAILPGLARMADSADGLKHGMLQITSAVLLVTLPAAFGMAAIAEPMVLTLLGNQWPGVVGVLQILAFAGALQSLTANNHSAYLAAAKTHVPVYINAAFVLTLIPLLYLLRAYGVVGVAWAQFGAMVVSVTVSVGLMHRYLGTSLRDLAGAVWRPLSAAALMALAVYWLDQNQFGFTSALPPYARLVLGVIAGVVLYIPLAGGLWVLSGRGEGLERVVYERARAVLQRAG
ncbi:MAG TPA: lipopolysaccharide biosynthesis protein [Burkholderiaceae bacterium]|nr:lipopolysaccharide biosynthesis protein [Burkholderiaceae bacterium]